MLPATKCLRWLPQILAHTSELKNSLGLSWIWKGKKNSPNLKGHVWVSKYVVALINGLFMYVCNMCVTYNPGATFCRNLSKRSREDVMVMWPKIMSPRKSSGRRRICRGGTGYEQTERLCRINELHSARWQESQSPQRVMRKDGPWKWTCHKYS